MASKCKINVGDRVAYSANFLRSIGCFTGDMPRLRGIVTELKQLGGADGVWLARIDWETKCDGEEWPARVAVPNLAKCGTRAMVAD